MIAQKRKGMFVAKEKGLAVCAVIAPTRNEARLRIEFFMRLR